MTFLRVPYLLVGIAAGLGAALWLNGIMPPVGLTAGASTVIQALVVVATAVITMLATAAGALVASDWQADVQSRQAWAQLGLTPAELSLPVDPETAGNSDPRYPASLDNGALRQVFRAHRFAQPEPVVDFPDLQAGIRATRVVLASAGSIPVQCTRDVAPESARDQENTTGKLSDADASGRALGKLIDTGAAGVSKVAPSHRAAQIRVKQTVSRPRLVANSHAWSDWVTHDARIPASYTADVIVLSGGRDDQTQPLPDVCVGPNGSEGTAPPSCRGPPQLVAREARAAGTTCAQRSVERAGVVSAADPVVRDNLGPQIPVCAAELDVIEAYLGHVLQDVLASSTSDPEPEQV